MPSVVEASEEFAVRSAQQKCWDFFSDLSNIGACIPGCEGVTPIDKTTALFKVKVKVGYLSRTFELKARLKEASPPSHLSFTGEGSDAEITGNLDINPTGEQTVVKYRIEIRAISVTGKTALAMIGKDLVKKQASEFASCVKQKLESPA